jgi:hypothetical protein
MSVQVPELKASVKYYSGSDKAGVNERRSFSNGSDIRKYSQASNGSAMWKANLTTVLNSHSTTDVTAAVVENQGIEIDRKPRTNTTLIDFGGTLYNSIESVLRNCYYEYSPGTIPYETEKRFVKCLKQAAIREMKLILNYNGSSGPLEQQENGDYRVGKMDQLMDIDGMLRRVNLRMKLMSGLFLWVSQREDSLRVGMELDEGEISRLEGELSQHQHKLNQLSSVIKLFI